ncbi:MAG TPA: heme-dependent oxidative N-demethylase subunit alpha family protein [Fimbriimonadaceae bacterium]|nr:heme-dependent oxidative N-demethylase subunit alpha family protein [Fimbriimonadaceae bacterium]
MPDLPLPAAFYPWIKSVYSVAPAMRKLGSDFGNGDADRNLILLDAGFPRYRANKLACLQEHPGKYFLESDMAPGTCVAALNAIAGHLAADHPDTFEFTRRSLTSRITEETIAWNEDGSLDAKRTAADPAIRTSWQGLALQIQADLALIARRPDGTDYVAALCACAPSDWSPAEKIGRSFFEAHMPVPGFDRINAAAGQLVQSIIHHGPFVRFVWGVESDDRLNHHPDAPPGFDRVEWRGRRYGRGRFWARIERQSTLGLPEVDAALFFIHVQTIPDTVILASRHLREALRQGLLSMSPEARRYKGVEEGFDDLMRMLADATG